MIFKANNVDDYALVQNTEAIQQASAQSKRVLEEIISFIKPGIKESEAYNFTKQIYSDYGITRSWHNPYIRFGTNTTLTYADKASEDITLKDNDIAFIDIGPIWGEIEGDAGKTIVFGDNEIFYQLKNTSEILFQEGLDYFKTQNPTGIEMQEFISKQSKIIGYEYLLKSGGHLIGLFSHGAAWNKGIALYDKPMQPGIWILEVHIKDPYTPYGAFFEDILF